MSKTKWLRRALLGGVALSVTATGAKADELSALKAQLEALQSRVNSLESAPAPAALPEGYSYMTYARGAGSNDDWGNEAKTDLINQTTDRGFTVAVTPTADLPAPVAEVTVYGYVKGDVIYAFDDNNFEPSTHWSTFMGNGNSSDHITIHAKQSRFGIKSKVDTAIGQIRTRIEGDFEGSPYGRTDNFRLRHAYGEWDMTENLTLVVGQYWRIGSLLPIGISTVNFFGTGGLTYSRDPQVSITYSDGPLTIRLGIEEPIDRTDSNVPDFGGSIQYDIPGGHTIVASGQIGVVDEQSFAAGNSDELSWMVSGGFNMNLADMATLTGGVIWGEGPVIGKYHSTPHATFRFAQGDLAEHLGLMAGISVPITETTTFNFAWDYMDAQDGWARAGNQDELHSFHANILWQPVKQMRMGWEVAYFTAGDKSQGNPVSDEYAQIQWGTWFFF